MIKIQRIHNPSTDNFTADFLVPQSPCIITGAIENWQALLLWNRDYLQRKIGDTVVRCRVSNSNYFDNYNRHKAIKIAFFLDWIKSQEKEQDKFLQLFGKRKSAKQYFIGSLDIPTYFPEIASDIQQLPYVPSNLLTSNNLWLGYGGNRVNLHYDLFHNINAQIIGKKHWIIFPPQQSSLLYPNPWYSRFFWCSRVNIEQPNYEQFPLFKSAQPIEVIVEPGEVLFLPAGWWHSPIGVGFNVAVNFWWRLKVGEFINTWLGKKIPLSWRLKTQNAEIFQ